MIGWEIEGEGKRKERRPNKENQDAIIVYCHNNFQHKYYCFLSRQFLLVSFYFIHFNSYHLPSKLEFPS